MKGEFEMGIKKKGLLVLSTGTAYSYCVLRTGTAYSYCVLVLRTRTGTAYWYCVPVMEIGHGKKKKKNKWHACLSSCSRNVEKGNLKGTDRRGNWKGDLKGKLKRGV